MMMGLTQLSKVFKCFVWIYKLKLMTNVVVQSEDQLR